MSRVATLSVDQQFERIIAQEWESAISAFPELVGEANERTTQFIGNIAVNKLVGIESVSEDRPATTLQAAALLGRLGDKPSQRLVYMSASTDLSERMYKSKNETEVHMQIVDGHLMQNGRRNTDVVGNTFQHSELNATMYDISSAEHSNAHLFDLLLEEGLLDTHDALVASGTPTDLETRRKYNYFEATDTMSLQLLSKKGKEAVLQTAFVAGKITPQAPRHDMHAIKAVAKNHGVDLQDISEEQLVRYVILIPKGSLPNGVTTIVEEYDDAAGGTFYGEDEERQDYKEFSEMCRNRDFSVMAWNVANKLMNESHTFKSPMDAVRRLNKLAGAVAVIHAVENTEIDTNIFGELASEYVQMARHALETGDIDGLKSMMFMAVQTEKSGSCPLSEEMMAGGQDEYGSLEFDCPSCKQKNTRPRGKLLDSCQHCTSTKVAC